MAVPITIPLAFMLALSAMMLWVIVSDAAHYIIPNSLNLVILILFIVAVFHLPINAPWALGMAAIMLVVGIGIFSLGLMGGGDVKLLVVLSLWTGWGMATLQFLFLTALMGGLLVVLVLLLRTTLSPLLLKLRPTRNLPRLLRRKEPVPYGLAIAAAFLWMLWTGQVPPLA